VWTECSNRHGGDRAHLFAARDCTKWASFASCAREAKRALPLSVFSLMRSHTHKTAPLCLFHFEWNSAVSLFLRSLAVWPSAHPLPTLLSLSVSLQRGSLNGLVLHSICSQVGQSDSISSGASSLSVCRNSPQSWKAKKRKEQPKRVHSVLLGQFVVAPSSLESFVLVLVLFLLFLAADLFWPTKRQQRPTNGRKIIHF